MRLRYTDQADRDLDALLADTAEQWPASLRKTMGRLRKFEQVVLQFPRAGQRTRFAGIRRYSLVPLRYVAFYRVTAREIIALRLYHTAQGSFDPEAA